MLWAVTIFLLFLWVLGVIVSAHPSVHVLLIAALVLLVVQLVRDNNARHR